MSEVQKSGQERFEPANPVLKRQVILYERAVEEKPTAFIQRFIGDVRCDSMRRTKLVTLDENVFYAHTMHNAIIAIRSNELAKCPVIDNRSKKWNEFFEFTRNELIRWDDAIASDPEETERIMTQMPPKVIGKFWISASNLIEVGLGDVPNSRQCFQWHIQENRRRAIGHYHDRELSQCPRCIEEDRRVEPFSTTFCLRHRWCDASYVGWTFWPGTNRPMTPIRMPKRIDMRPKAPEPTKLKPLIIEVITLDPSRPKPDSFTDLASLKEYGNAMIDLYQSASDDVRFLSRDMRPRAEKSLDELSQYIAALRTRAAELG